MGVFQIITLVLFLISLLINAHLHGTEKKEKHNFFVTLLSVILNFLILYWGGFYK
jgi:hypothetical protein